MRSLAQPQDVINFFSSKVFIQVLIISEIYFLVRCPQEITFRHYDVICDVTKTDLARYFGLKPAYTETLAQKT